jgi:hypothetical protein
VKKAVVGGAGHGVGGDGLLAEAHLDRAKALAVVRGQACTEYAHRAARVFDGTSIPESITAENEL